MKISDFNSVIQYAEEATGFRLKARGVMQN